MPAITFNTANQTYRQLIGNGLIYNVPRFQRDYSWTEQEWDDLWADMQDLFSADGEPAHYMGYVVLQSTDNKKFHIIDGQQRLTTLSIFTLAVLKNLDALITLGIEADDNKRRIEQLRNTFIGYLDPVTLIPQSKLTLNRNNNSFYQNYIVPLQPLPVRGLKATEQQMRKAFEWFEHKITQEYGRKKDGAILAGIIDRLSDLLFFTVITVTDELNAYKVFETLNARGVKLSSADLLKNHLFSVVNKEQGDERELNVLDERWETLVSKSGTDKFPDFLKTYWNSRHAFARQGNLFKVIKAKIISRKQVFELIRELEADADIYFALSRPEDVLWKTEQREYIRELKLFNTSHLYPLLLSGYRKLPEKQFTMLLKACSVISFRYNVIGELAVSEQEKVYIDIAGKLHNEMVRTIQDVLQALRIIYPNDDEFYLSFSEKQLKTTRLANKKMVRYILFTLESHVSGRSYDVNDSAYNIEHILPEHPGSGWEQFSDREHEAYVYRLGNMTLMKAGENRAVGNAGFELKKKALNNSVFVLTRRIVEHNQQWTTEAIAHTQRWMANQAKTIWRINQFDKG